MEYLTIKEVSKLLSVPEHTIRYYTDMGMIPNIKRSSGNYRLFDEEAIDWLKGTIYFRQMGLSLKDIKHYHDLCFSEDPEALYERYRLLQKYCEIAEKELINAKERLEHMKRITERDRQIAQELMPDKMNPYKSRKKSGR